MMRKLMVAGLLLPCLIVYGQSLEDHILQGKEKIAAAVSSWDEKEMLEARASSNESLPWGRRSGWLTITLRTATGG